MQGKVNYTVVGVFVVVLTAVLLMTVIWLSTIGHGKLYRTYWVYVHEDVTGLNEESLVRFNGVKVGYVESITLDQQNSKLVKIVLRVEPDVVITTGTYAMLNVQGLTGVVYVNLKADTEKAPPLVATAGQPYPIIPSKPSFLMQLSTALPEVTADIQKLSASVADVLNKNNRESIQESLQNIAVVSKALSDNSEEFTDTIHSLRHTLENISKASDQFPDTIGQMNKTLQSVDQLSLQMNQMSQNISNTMQSGRAVLNNFSNQVMPNAEQALSSLSQVSLSVQHLTNELQRAPSMLVRGRAHDSNTLGPGEK